MAKTTKFIGPKGDTRLRLSDIKKPEGDDAPLKFTLYEILIGDTSRVPTNRGDDSLIEFTPLNLKGLAMIEREFGGLDQLPAKPTMAQIVKLAGILVNQERATSEHLSDDDVGRLLDAKNITLINTAITAMITPLLDAPDKGAQKIAPQRRVGSDSSGSSSKSSAKSIQSRSGSSD